MQPVSILKLWLRLEFISVDTAYLDAVSLSPEIVDLELLPPNLVC